MRRNQDYLPRGVRWAVRTLRLCGTVIILPMLCLLPILLLSCVIILSKAGSPWAFDLLWIGYCLPLAVGGAMRVTATCIEISHDPRFLLTDSEMEWKKFAMACLCILAIGLCFGVIVSLIKLGIDWNGKHADLILPIMNLVMHIGLVILLYVGCRYLEEWFSRRRKRHGAER